VSDNGRKERAAAWLLTHRQATDNFRLRAGIMAAQMECSKQYGAGVIDDLARDSGFHKSTLYEYAQVARFLVRWLQYSARQIFSLYPMLTYSHLRTAVRLEYEEAIEALIHGNDEGMTPDQFSVYVAELRGKEPNVPVFKQAGTDHEVLMNLRRNYRPSGRRIEVTLKEVK
jgi:hypothetical protein